MQLDNYRVPQRLKISYNTVHHMWLIGIEEMETRRSSSRSTGLQVQKQFHYILSGSITTISVPGFLQVEEKLKFTA